MWSLSKYVAVCIDMYIFTISTVLHLVFDEVVPTDTKTCVLLVLSIQSYIKYTSFKEKISQYDNNNSSYILVENSGSRKQPVAW